MESQRSSNSSHSMSFPKGTSAILFSLGNLAVGDKARIFCRDSSATCIARVTCAPTIILSARDTTVIVSHSVAKTT